jgi:hypothetical protein
MPFPALIISVHHMEVELQNLELNFVLYKMIISCRPLSF